MSRGFVSRFASLVAGLAGLWLLGFHAVLLWRRIADASIQDPAVLARWIGSALLLGAVITARRYAMGRWSRRNCTFAFWILVLLLHVVIPADQRQLASDEVALLMTQTGLVSITAAFLAFTLVADLRPSAVRSRLMACGATPLALPVVICSAAPRAPPSTL
jgi:hypothetical protein